MCQPPQPFRLDEPDTPARFTKIARSPRLRYHLRVRDLAERLLQTIRKQRLIQPGDRVAVAVSGGADSVALLCLLLELRSELGIVLSVVHVNHKLRGKESDEDEAFVSDLARQNGLELHSRAAPLSRTLTSGIEAAARELRYDSFREVARGSRITKIATAHTLDDQAETVLLRAMRGSGLRGLAGIYPQLSPGTVGEAAIIRPLLALRRDQLKSYLGRLGQTWREDSSNRDTAFLRNRVRQRVLPVLREVFGPASVENLAELAEIARAEQEHWEADHPEVAAPQRPLAVSLVQRLSLAAQRQLIRNWLERNAPGVPRPLRLVENLIDLVHGDAGSRLEISAEATVHRTLNELRLESGSVLGPSDYEYCLTIPGQVEIVEINVRIEAVLEKNQGESMEQSLDPALLPSKLTIRNWRAGDRFWPANTKAEKKVKELLSDRHAAGTEKRLWPVAAGEGIGLVWVRGFAVPAKLRAKAGGRAVRIREREA